MKTLKNQVLSLALIFCCIISSAQVTRINEPDLSKPKLFQNQPTDILVNPVQLESLMDFQVGQEVNLSLGTGFQFQGHVVSTASKYENSIQSIVIASSNYQGARLTISKLTHPDKGVTYTGRIMSFKHGDLYELTTRNNQYYFEKKKFYDLVNE